MTGEIFEIPAEPTGFGSLHYDTQLRLKCISAYVVGQHGTPEDWRDTKKWQSISRTKADKCRKCGKRDNLTLHHLDSMGLSDFLIYAVRTAGQNLENTGTSASQQYLSKVVRENPLLFIVVADIFWRSYKEYYLSRENTITLCWDCHNDAELSASGRSNGKINENLKAASKELDKEDIISEDVSVAEQSTLSDFDG